MMPTGPDRPSRIIIPPHLMPPEPDPLRDDRPVSDRLAVAEREKQHAYRVVAHLVQQLGGRVVITDSALLESDEWGIRLTRTGLHTIVIESGPQ
jgi:hypothetical protein